MKEKNDLEELWEYVEPHESGGTCYTRMTKQQAINWMRNVYKNTDAYTTMNDEAIFQEWIVVNWAYKYEGL